MRKLICFDSNIYEFLVDKEKINKPEYKKLRIYSSIFKSISCMILKERIKSVISEQIITDEIIPKKERGDRIAEYSPVFDSKLHSVKSSTTPGCISVTVKRGIRQDEGKLPCWKDNLIAKEIFNTAVEDYGFKLLYAPHYFYGRSNKDLNKNDTKAAQYFLESNLEYGKLQERMQSALSIIKEITDHSVTLGDIEQRNNKKTRNKYYAEICDRDALASCFAYGIKYFCTFDKGDDLKEKAILNKIHSESVMKRLSINITSPKKLNESLLKIDKVCQI